MSHSFYTPEQVSEKYKVPVATVMRWIERGKIDYILEDGQYKIPSDQSNSPEGAEFWNKVELMSKYLSEIDDSEGE